MILLANKKIIQIVAMPATALFARGLERSINKDYFEPILHTWAEESSIETMRSSQLIFFIVASMAEPEKKILQRLNDHCPEVPVVLFSRNESFADLIYCIRLGVYGCFNFWTEQDKLFAMSMAIITKKSYFFDLQYERVLYEYEKDLKDPVRLQVADRMNSTEKKVLSLLCSPLSYEEVAPLVGMSLEALMEMRQKISKSLRFKSRIGIALFVWHNRLTE